MVRLIAFILTVLTLLSGCTIVYHNETQGKGNGQGYGLGSNANIFDAGEYVENIWDGELMLYAQEHATDISELIRALSTDVDAAGSAYGYRSVDQGGAWNFIASGIGIVTSVNTESRNGLIMLDVLDNDSKADVIIQIGPVIKGTSIRDSISIIRFDDFTNQLEFQNLATELNKKAYETVLAPITFHVGNEVAFIGMFTFSSAEEINIVPVSLAVGGA